MSLLDPQAGEILRATGNFLTERRKATVSECLNLVDPEASSRYIPPSFYLQKDDDVDQLVENFWKATTAGGGTAGVSRFGTIQPRNFCLLWPTTSITLPLPPEQNFPMIQFMVRNMAIEGEDKKAKSPVEQAL